MSGDDERADVTPIIFVPQGVKSSGETACLVVLAGKELGRRYPLRPGELDLGRESTCELVIEDKSASRRHSRIVFERDGYVIEDLGSTNGTTINEHRVDRHRLQDGDLVKVGRTVLKFLSGSTVESDYHSEVYRLTTTDVLTQTFNKRYLINHIERELARSLRYGRHLSLILFDIDHFKLLNDEHGHLVGDAALVGVVQRVKQTIRRADTFGRYGGEEFVVVAPEVPTRRARMLAEKIRKAVAAPPLVHDGKELNVSVSIGVADVDEYIAVRQAAGVDARGEPPDPYLLVKLADAKMYQAKAAGRDCVVS